MMISHVAIWVNDLERMKAFYELRFGAHSGKKYENLNKGFESYFLSFTSGARLELMRKKGVERSSDQSDTQTGFTHLAFSCGSADEVDRLTALLASEGLRVLSGPRTTGDGYYESVILDPEGNMIEITS